MGSKSLARSTVTPVEITVRKDHSLGHRSHVDARFVTQLFTRASAPRLVYLQLNAEPSLMRINSRNIRKYPSKRTGPESNGDKSVGTLDRSSEPVKTLRFFRSLVKLEFES